MNILKKIEKYDYISFDIFDTLIKRDTTPNDVFCIVELMYNEINKDKISSFKENRQIAMKKAYMKVEEEIDLDLIYDCLKEFYNEKQCDKLKELELDVEQNICSVNKNFRDIYKFCIDNNKKIIITSDMYLPKKIIEKILKKNGYEKYYKLYLSSDTKCRKSTGNIYNYILDDLKIEKKQLIHIGDNLIGDYLVPKTKGIASIKIPNYIRNLKFQNKKVPSEHIKNYKSLELFINNNLDSNKSYYWNMGYETFGPILYSFSKWLKENIKDRKIFFLSRDGYLMQKAFNIINNDNVNSTYFYGSRRSLIIPTLWLDNDLKTMLDKLYIRDYIKVGNLFRKLGLEQEQYKDIVENCGFSIEQNISYNDLFDNQEFQLLFNKLKPIIHSNSRKEYDLLIEYMKQENFNGNVAIIDIGWNGNMQRALQNIVNRLDQKINIEGYYMGILPESKNISKIKMNGFLFDSKNNYDIYICLKVINSIFESLFLAPHGSVKTYCKTKGKIEPVLLDYEYENSIEKDYYMEIQKGALSFIKDFNDSYANKFINIDNVLSFYNMNKFAYYPSLEDTKKFGDFKFLEDDVIYIANPKGIFYYLTHPKKAFSDLYLSGWIIGFMKRLLKVNLFYPQIYKVFIEFYMKRRNARK